MKSCLLRASQGLRETNKGWRDPSGGTGSGELSPPGEEAVSQRSEGRAAAVAGVAGHPTEGVAVGEEGALSSPRPCRIVTEGISTQASRSSLPPVPCCSSYGPTQLKARERKSLVGIIHGGQPPGAQKRGEEEEEVSPGSMGNTQHKCLGEK